MMKLNRTLKIIGAAVAVACAAASANAAILVDDWRIDLGAIGNLGAGQDNWTGYGVFGQNAALGIDSMAFSALYHTIIAGAIAPGTLQHTDTMGVITQAINQNGLVGGTTTAALLNNDNLSTLLGLNTFELTFASTTTQVISTVVPPVVTTTHLAPGAGPNGVATNGSLNIYADICAANSGVFTKNGDGSTCGNTSATTGGGGMLDGLLIASFAIVPAALPTGSFNVAALDGQDDATFVMTYNYNGVVKDKFNNSLAVGSTLAFTNSNTDADDDNNGAIDTVPGGWGTQGLGACGTSIVDQCGLEDGTVNLAVPEPGSVALVGGALLGLGLARRRNRKV